MIQGGQEFRRSSAVSDSSGGQFSRKSDRHMLLSQRCLRLCHEDPDVLTLNSTIQRDPKVIAAKADQDLIMVSVTTGYYYGLSDVAREIWNAIGGPKKIADLVDDLTASYQIDSPSCEEQVLSFLEELLDEGLLQVKDAPAG
jgi:hypothetical protein